jgi:hypothetical protein
MRVVVGYDNGNPIWSESVPAYGGSIRFGGSLDFGASGTIGMRRDRKRNHAAREREARERDEQVTT